MLSNHAYLPAIRNGTNEISGTVVIEGGNCCISGLYGDILHIHAQFSASSLSSQVTQMRTQPSYGGSCVPSEFLEAQNWKPFTPEVDYLIHVSAQQNAFYVSVQYRAANGEVSRVYCDDILVETQFPTVTVTPAATQRGNNLAQRSTAEILLENGQ